MITPIPPRSLTVPQMPNPQTVFGVLSDTGEPSVIENITDLGPDFSWMSAVEEFVHDFTVKEADSALVDIFYPQKKVKTPIMPTLDDMTMSWHWIPFSASRWWNGPCRLRFMAIKPPRVPGKLLIRYNPDPSTTSEVAFESDSLRRGIKFEWDLGLSSECSIDIHGYNWTSLRPTWIPRVSASDTGPTVLDTAGFKHIMPHLSQISLGRLRIEIANPIVPGNIFPDSIRILVFQSFPGAQFFDATDTRSIKYHFFMLGSPWPLNVKNKIPNV